MTEFSHIDKNGDVKMVDVTEKFSTARIAIAEGKIYMSSKTIEAIKNTVLPKGNVLTTAKIAGIQAAKNA